MCGGWDRVVMGVLRGHEVADRVRVGSKVGLDQNGLLEVISSGNGGSSPRGFLEQHLDFVVDVFDHRGDFS